ncbi:hypothetical protein [Cognatilysobacter bugurensis]|uniref:Uncharacterized protein n=1 Tax=Cognatilysobacter bugurensis TaxID=543356 RepID=A0A918W6M7_9GAMM|nr:hypothetical protein [Lysobacter bugurensis]GHA74047.1 hypothetical protein GCM10007067_08680 [Lysobacter bugurensis]
MAPAPDDIQSLLYGLESRLPSMLADAASREAFLEAFDPQAREIAEVAGEERSAYVRTELQRMLASQGVIESPFESPIDPIDPTKDQ